MSASWIDFNLTGGQLADYIPGVSHEFGHSFGRGHANYLNCGPAVVSTAAHCTSHEYGDFYSIMGFYNNGHMNAQEKDYLGWFVASQIATVTQPQQSGSYTLEPLETNSPGLKTVKIQRGPSDWVYVEYRQRIGADSNLDRPVLENSDIYSGAFVHGTHPVSQSYQSSLWDMSPADGSSIFEWVVHVTLPLGQTFTDPMTGTAITVTGRTASALTLNINVPAAVDTDGDGFSNWLEAYLGTDPNDACSNTATPNDETVDAWPPDLNDDRFVDISDVSMLTAYMGESVPPAPQRYDLNPDGAIDSKDSDIITGLNGTSCSP